MSKLLGISRREFLGGVAVTGLAAGLSPLAAMQAGLVSSEGAWTYPPEKTGLRGSHAGSFEVAHGVAWGGDQFEYPQKRTDQLYDLIIVGGGISGLSAALMAKDKLGSKARILIIDNHDDFGGHAKRNEFTVGGKKLIGYGGSQSIDNPASYSRESAAFLTSLGIETERFYRHFDASFYERHEMSPSIYLDAYNFGSDQLLARNSGNGALDLWSFDDEDGRRSLADTIAALPVDKDDKGKLERLFLAQVDWLAKHGHAEKIRLLKHKSYEQCLRDYVGLSEKALHIIRNDYVGMWGLGWDALSGLEAVRLNHPGTIGLGVASATVPDAYEGDEPYIFHFPDGNAAIARMAVSKLLPDSVSGSGMDGTVKARVHYDRLDLARNNTRIRLNSTVVDVKIPPPVRQ